MGVVQPSVVSGAVVGGAVVSGAVAGAGGETGTVTIEMSTSVDELDLTDDLGAAFQATGGHTMYGGGTYFDSDQYLWTSVNGVGIDPGLSGTGHEVALTGTAPFTGTAWATAAETVITAAGRTVSRSTDTLTVTVASPARATTAAANQAALTSFVDRGGGRIIGSLEQDAGSSFNAGGQGWIQVLPADVPSGAFRVIAFGCRRGSGVANGIRMSCGQGGADDGDPEGLTVDHDRTMGNSGANNWHWEFLDTPVTYSGGERLWIGSHGNGNSTTTLFSGGALNDGTYQDGSDNLWTTDGTTGDTTPTVSPAGAVTGSFNFGLSLRLLIQEAPYQTDGAYRVIGGAVPGVHDGNLFASGTPVNDIFVSWRIVPPSIDDLYLMDLGIRLQAHDSDATDQIRFEWWTADGGASTMAGDVLVSLIGVTASDQGTGWSFVTPASPISVTGGTTYRWSFKGEPAAGEANDTILDVWLGTAGADSVTNAGFPTYAPSGTNIPATEREVDGNVDETAIDFDPSVATASPNPADGTVISPNNLSMTSLYFGKPGPTVTAG